MAASEAARPAGKPTDPDALATGTIDRERTLPSDRPEVPWQRRRKQQRRGKTAARRTASKRELVNTGTNKLFVRRNKRGTSFKEVEDVGRSR